MIYEHTPKYDICGRFLTAKKREQAGVLCLVTKDEDTETER